MGELNSTFIDNNLRVSEHHREHTRKEVNTKKELIFIF